MTDKPPPSPSNEAPLISGNPRSRYHVTVEPVLFLVFLGQMLSNAVFTNLLLMRSCQVTLGYNDSTCAALDDKDRGAELEVEVQPYVAELQMYKSIIEACIPALLFLFIGPWSDVHGRRPIILWTMIGYSLTFWSLCGLSLIPRLDPRFVLLSSLPLACSGSYMCIIVICYSYITDISSPDRRAFRMAIADAGLFLGLLMGTFLSSYLFLGAGDLGFAATFGVSASIYLVSFLYVKFYLKESLDLQQGDSVNYGLAGLFNWRLVRDMFHKCCQPRPNHGRIITILLMGVLVTYLITAEGEGTVIFLYTRHKFGWNIRTYTTYSSVGILVGIVGALSALAILSSWLKVPDAPLAMTALSTKMIGSIIQAMSPQSWYMYLGSAVGMISGIYGPLCRSIISKTVSKHDVGTVFSMVASLEAMAPFIAAPLYTLVYNATLLSFPGAFLLVSAGIYALDVFLVSIVGILQWLTRMDPANLPVPRI